MRYDIKTMTKDERSILLYAESCSVDNSGLLEGVRMNAEDLVNLCKMKDAGLLDFGRSPAKSIALSKGKTHWVTLTEDGWNLAHELRRLRSNQIGVYRQEVNDILSEREAA